MMKMTKKRVMSVLLALVMLIGMLPMSALAVEEEGTTGTESVDSNALSFSLASPQLTSTGTTAEYAVVYWLENAEGDGYAYGFYEKKSGNIGAQTEAAFLTDDSRVANYTPHGTIEQKTIEDEGTIVNVYYDRVEFTLTMHYGYSNRQYTKTGTITAKWGSNIGEQWQAFNEVTGSLWSPDGSSPYTEYLEIMPAENRHYYNKSDITGMTKGTVHYYCEELDGKSYKERLTITFYYDDTLVITEDEDAFPIDGFTYSGKHSGNGCSGNNLNGAKFYYTRNSYKVHYYSYDTDGDLIDAIDPVTLKFEASLADCNVTPASVKGYTFEGWYLDQTYQVPFDFSGTMPSHDVLLYAKYSKDIEETMTIKGVDYSGAFDGKEHGEKADCNEEDATITYSTDGGNTWTSKIPTIKEVGTVKAIAKAEKTGFKTVTDDYTLTVTPATGLTINIPTEEFTYNGELQGNAVTTNITEGSTIEYSTDGVNWSTDVPQIKNVADSKDIYVRVSNPNYETVTGKYTLTINPKAVTVTADPLKKIYGEANPELTATVTGLVGEDTIAYKLDCKAGLTSDVGEYPILATGEDNQGNYTVSYTAGKLIIEKADGMTIDVKNAGFSGEYDGQKHGGAATAADGATIWYSTDGGEHWTTVAPTQTDAGTTTVKVKAEHKNYKTVEATYTINVTQKPVTVTAINCTKTYGSDNPAFTATVVGTIGSDEVSYTFDTTATSTSPVGTYDIIPKGEASQGNYSVTFNNGTLTVNKAKGMTVDVSGSGYNGLYNGTAHGAAAVPSVEAGTTVEYSTDGGTTWKTEVPTQKDAGTLNVKVKVTNKNYEDAYGNYTINVSKRSVTLTSATDSKVYDGYNVTALTNHNVTVSGDGFAEGEGATYNVTGSQTEVGSSYNSFTYTLKEGTKADNYTIQMEEGTLTVAENPVLIVDTTGCAGTWTYDGQEHGKAPKANVAEATILYSVDGGDWKTDVPTIKDFGTKTVKVKARLEGYTDSEQEEYTLTVTQASVTVTAKDCTKTYGSDNPAFTATVVGTIGSDEVSYTFDTTATSTSPVGTYDIIPKGEASQGNYSVTFNNGTLTVNKAKGMTVDVSGSGYDDLYDGYPHGVAAVPSVEAGTTVEYSTDGGTTWKTEVPTQKDAGTLNVKVKVTNKNYEDAYGNYTINVSKRSVTLTSATDSKVFDGDPLTNNKVSESGKGFAADEGATYNVTGSQTDVGSSKNTFGYTLNEGTKADNYNIKTEEGTLTVTESDKLSIDVSGSKYQGVYDGDPHSGKAPVIKDGKGTTISDATIQYSTDGGLTWQTELPTRTNAGTTKVMVKADYANYKTATAEYKIEISRKAVVVKAKNEKKTYGEENPDFTATVTGLVGKDTIVYKLNCAAKQDSDAGSYDIVPSGTSVQDNYTVSYQKGTLTVEKASGMTIDLSECGYNDTYDGKYHGGEATAKKGGATIEGATISYSTVADVWTSTPIIRKDAGTTTVSVKAEHKNYETVTVENAYTIQINPKAVTVSAIDQSRKYGEKNPEWAAIVEGTIGTETVAYNLTCDATTASDAGDYDIVATGEADQKNYTVTFKNGTLTVQKLTGLTVDVSGSGYNGLYDGTAHGKAAVPNIKDGTKVEYSTDGGTTYSEKVPTQTDVGTLDVMVKVTKPNYEDAEGSYTIKVSKRSVTLTSGSASKEYDGDPLTKNNVSESGNGFVAGQGATYDVIGSQTNVGTSKNTFVYVLKSGTEAGNYNISAVEGDLEVTKSKALKIDTSSSGFNGLYDGTAHGGPAKPNMKDAEITYSIDGGKTWSPTVPTRTDAGTTTVMVKADLKDDNYEVATASYTINVKQRGVVLSSGGGSKEYDGKPLTNGTVTISGDGFVSGEGISYKVSGSQTDPGSSKNTFSYTLNGNTKASNYAITAVEGTLTVTGESKTSIKIQTPPGEYEYNGKPQGEGVDPDTLPEGSEVEYSEDGGKTWTKKVPQITDVNEGPKTILIRVTNPDYLTTETEYVLQITPKKVTVKPENITIKEGETEPELKATVSGLVGNDTIEYTLKREAGDSVGKYKISASGKEDQGNYTVSFGSATFTIAEAAKKETPTEYYELIIHYSFEDGTKAAEDFVGSIKAGESYVVESPEVDGYDPSVRYLYIEEMTDASEVTVIYYEKGTGETAEWGQDIENEIVIIDEDKVPLAAKEGDHGICILHVIIIILAFLTQLLYLHKKKKYQEDILDLQSTILSK